MSEGKIRPGQPASSWMVRCWEEPREQGSEPPVYRFFVRDLKTGEERYLSDPRELGELILRRTRESRRTLKEIQKKRQID